MPTQRPSSRATACDESEQTLFRVCPATGVKRTPLEESWGPEFRPGAQSWRDIFVDFHPDIDIFVGHSSLVLPLLSSLPCTFPLVLSNHRGSACVTETFLARTLQKAYKRTV